MPTLLLPPRYTSDSQGLWRVASRINWRTHRLQGWRAPEPESLTPPLVLYGEPLFVATIAQQLGIGLIEPPFDWLTQLPADLLGREVRALTLGQLPQVAFPAFVKPADDKCFPAAVYDSLEALYDAIQLRESLPLQTPILTSTPVVWHTEYRFFVREGAVMTGSLYSLAGELIEAGAQDPQPQQAQTTLPDAQHFTQALVEQLQQGGEEGTLVPPAVVIDVGWIQGHGWAVIEANPCWGAGLYKCDPAAALATLQRASQPLTQLPDADRRWLIEREVDWS